MSPCPLNSHQEVNLELGDPQAGVGDQSYRLQGQCQAAPRTEPVVGVWRGGGMGQRDAGVTDASALLLGSSERRQVEGQLPALQVPGRTDGRVRTPIAIVQFLMQFLFQ